MPNHFTVVEAAELSGILPATLRKYCHGFSDLVRGEDFYVRRFSPTRRRLFITPRGLYRLRTHSYSTFQASKPRPQLHFDPALPWRYDGNNRDELNQRLKSRVMLTMRRYATSPCAVPGCPCVTHKLGLPQADEYARLRELEREARERRR